MNIFEQATRRKIRFPSGRGSLTTEMLWDVPLRATDKGGDATFNMDAIAKELDARVKAEATESFVDPSTNTASTDSVLALEVVKHVIATKLEEEHKRRGEASRRAELRSITEELHERNQQALKSMSVADLEKRAAALREGA